MLSGANNLVPIAASQIKWSLAVPNDGTGDPTLVEMDSEEYKEYRNAGLPVVAYSSQGKGIFSLLQSGGIAALNEGIRKTYLNSINLERFMVAQKLAEKYRVPVSSIVLAYIYSNPDISAHVLIGPINTEQLEDSLTDSGLVLSGGEIAQLSLENR